MLELTDISGNNYEIMTTDSTVKLNAWNFFALDFYNREDEGSSGISEYVLFLNGGLKRVSRNRISISVGIEPRFHIHQVI